MTKPKKLGRSRAGRSRTGLKRHEWVGGRLLSPFYITEGGPYRPELILWLELPDDIVVSFTLLDPRKGSVSLSEMLQNAMKSPLVGPPRRPPRVRVDDALAVHELQQAFPDLEIVKAPTPELNRILEAMAQSEGVERFGTERSYFEEGVLSTELLDGLFRIAQVLYHLAPWKFANEDQVLRLDIPQLGIEGACLSIIGILGESRGFIIFPSKVALENFLDAAHVGNDTDAPIDMGTTTLSLDYERGADLPGVMLREVTEHGWPVAGPDAYPIVNHRDQDGVPRPLTEHDLRVVSACATSLVALFAKHSHIFSREGLDEPVCLSFYDEDDLEVRFTMPYEAGTSFAVNKNPPAGVSSPLPGLESERPPTITGAKIGRNQPCPCGSGRKYKKCCLPRVQRESE